VSGICGIAHVDGASVDASALERMTQSMAFRGPDAQETWAEGGVGLGHALLRTTFESEGERQPLSFDGQVWITADARLDARKEMICARSSGGREARRDMPDVALVLHAYHAWGEACVRHLLGDFAFGIWDARSRSLFCARDHFGIKPFFYSQAGGCLVFSNTLECVRRHPAVSADLNELAIADFLLFGENLEPDTTAFAQVMRLASGHCMTWSAEGLEVRAYWTLPRDIQVSHRAAGDYVERFRELFDIAVSDRLRTNRVGIEMTGGMDSTSVAVTAQALLRRQGGPFQLSAYTGIFEHLIPDEEGRYASMVAQSAGFALRVLPSDDYRLFDRFDTPYVRLPEPFHDPVHVQRRDICRDAAAESRVFLTGWEGDAMLNETPKPYFRDLMRRGAWPRAAMGMLGYAVMQRRLVPLALRDRVRGAGAPGGPQEVPYPTWISPALESRWKLRERWDNHRARARMDHPLRPNAFGIYDYLARASNHFDWYDAGITQQPMEYRHPLMDVRLVEYCLALPPYPWCVKKHILRTAMADRLPEAVLRRPKTPLGPWWAAMLRRDRGGLPGSIAPSAALRRFVDAQGLRLNSADADPRIAWRDLRVMSLHYWLQSAGIGQ
jgi:asparagine synthase (glutamine-hydrolysing)